MPFDVLGCTRAALMKWLGNLWSVHRDGDGSLRLLLLNEEFLVNVSHQLLPFVHTARRSCRLSGPVNSLVPL